MSGVRGLPAPDRVKVSVNLVGGWRNTMTFVLTGLEIEAKAELLRRTIASVLDGPQRPAEVDVRLIRTDRVDAPTNEEASAQLRITVKDPDPDKVGRRFSGAVTELALASYPGFYLTTPPGEATAYGVYWPTLVPATEVEQVVVHDDGRRVRIPVVPPTSAPWHGDEPRARKEDDTEGVSWGPTRRVALGVVAGARSGDKGGNANVGFWARLPGAFAWLEAELTIERFRRLLPEASGLGVQRHVFANLHAINFVVEGLLGEGVASSTRPDPQAKSLGEYLRSRLVDVPVSILDDLGNAAPK
jgi:hypothetical protein